MTIKDGSWRDAMAVCSADIDGEFGEALTLIATVARPNMQAQLDKRFEAVVTRGRFNLRSELALKNSTALVETRTPVATFDMDTLRALPFRFGEGMRITRENGDQYEVSHAQADGVSRVTFALLHLGIPEAVEGPVGLVKLADKPAPTRVITSDQPMVMRNAFPDDRS